jgi:hypothetical protein
VEGRLRDEFGVRIAVEVLPAEDLGRLTGSDRGVKPRRFEDRSR